MLFPPPRKAGISKASAPDSMEMGAESFYYMMTDSLKSKEKSGQDLFPLTKIKLTHNIMYTNI